MIDFLKVIFDKWQHPVEIVVLWVLLYAVLYSLRGTRFSGILRGAFAGIVIFIIAIQFLSSLLQLEQLNVMINLLLGTLAFAVLVIFAQDMRRALTRFAESPLLPPLLQAPARRTIEPIADAAMRMAQNRIGALIVLEKEIGLRDVIEKCVKLDAEVTAQLLQTIFYPGSALHDGAAIVQNDRVVAAACFLPLTDNPDVARTLGTRHRAAMGITEETDSVAVVVSEETGTVSVCMRGAIVRGLDRSGLIEKLTESVGSDTRPIRGPWAKLMRPLTRRRHAEDDPKPPPAQSHGDPAAPTQPKSEEPAA